MTSSTTELSTALQAKRQERNMTQRSVADLFGISQPTYQGWEAGFGLPKLSVELFDLLAEFLDLDESALEHVLIRSEFVVNARRARR
jgi:transcriptional regulator with XRE-family HTH domain